MALRIAPSSSLPSNTSSALGAPSAPGIHDTLRSNLGLNSPSASSDVASFISPTDAPLQSSHPLEARLAKWRATQDALKMEGLRRVYGIGEPVRRGMELRIAAQGEWRPAVLGGASTVHGDVLAGRDCEIGWEDIFRGDELRDVPDFHTEMEAKLRMNW